MEPILSGHAVELHAKNLSPQKFAVNTMET